MSSAASILADPEFHQLPIQDRIGIMSAKDPEFGRLGPEDQSGIMTHAEARFGAPKFVPTVPPLQTPADLEHAEHQQFRENHPIGPALWYGLGSGAPIPGPAVLEENSMSAIAPKIASALPELGPLSRAVLHLLPGGRTLLRAYDAVGSLMPKPGQGPAVGAWEGPMPKPGFETGPWEGPELKPKIPIQYGPWEGPMERPEPPIDYKPGLKGSPYLKFTPGPETEPTGFSSGIKTPIRIKPSDVPGALSREPIPPIDSSTGQVVKPIQPEGHFPSQSQGAPMSQPGPTDTTIPSHYLERGNPTAAMNLDKRVVDQMQKLGQMPTRREGLTPEKINQFRQSVGSRAMDPKDHSMILDHVWKEIQKRSTK